VSVGWLTLALILSLFALLATGLPVAFVLIGVSLIFFIILKGPIVFYMLFAVTLGTTLKDIYIAVPLFVFMAAVLQFSGLASALYDTMYKWFAGLRGGLAMGTVVICTFIAAMTGLGATGTVTMGMLALPEMLKRRYDKIIAVGCIPFGGSLGPLIPPSIIMIILGGLTTISVGKLFMGGIFPGLIGAFLGIVYIGIRAFRNPALAPSIPLEERATWGAKFKSLVVVLPTIALIGVVLGSIYRGVCTPTEAGGVGSIGALICAAIYRRLNWKNIKEGALNTFRVSAMVMWLLIGGTMFASLTATAGISHFIAETLTGLAIPPVGVIVIMMAIALFMGMIMDGAAVTMICIPIFMPVVMVMGYDPLWFALLFTINVIIGYISPPFGMNLFYMRGLVPPGITLGDIYKSAIPYCLILLIVLALGIAFPQILLYLPSTMVK